MEARRVGASVNHYMHSDILGSITSITNASGNVLSTYEYDVYGLLLSGNTDYLDNFGFTGQEIDLETGYYHFPARYYEPYWGRFLTPDPWTGMPDDERNLMIQKYIPRTPDVYKILAHPQFFDGPISIHANHPAMLNLYQYVTNSPVNFTDEHGLFMSPECITALAFSIRLWKLMRHQPGKWNDKFFHCLASCEVGKACGRAASLLLGIGVEVAEDLTGGAVDPWDLAADLKGLTYPKDKTCAEHCLKQYSPIKLR